MGKQQSRLGFIIAGLLFGIFAAAIDNTIVATRHGHDRRRSGRPRQVCVGDFRLSRDRDGIAAWHANTGHVQVAVDRLHDRSGFGRRILILGARGGGHSLLRHAPAGLGELDAGFRSLTWHDSGNNRVWHDPAKPVDEQAQRRVWRGRRIDRRNVRQCQESTGRSEPGESGNERRALIWGCHAVALHAPAASVYGTSLTSDI